jgi:hypothetical protein
LYQGTTLVVPIKFNKTWASAPAAGGFSRRKSGLENYELKRLEI